MLRSFWIALLLLAAGITIVLMPDNGKQLLIINQYHGPSALDSIGLAIIILVWIWLLCRVIINWKKVRSALQIKGIMIALLLVVAGTITIAVTLSLNMQHSWITGALMAIAGYAILFIAAFKKAE